MANKLEPEDIEWQFIGSMAFTTYHHAKSINLEYGVEKEEITKVKSDGNFAKKKLYYYITGQDKEYTDLQALCNDWNEIKDYDDPNSEIRWEKKIVPVIKLNDPKKDQCI